MPLCVLFHTYVHTYICMYKIFIPFLYFKYLIFLFLLEKWAQTELKDEYCIRLRKSGWSFPPKFCLWKEIIVKLHRVKCMECDYFSFFSGSYISYQVLQFSISGKNLYRNCSLSTSLWKDKVERVGVSAVKIGKLLLIIVLLQAATRKENFIAVGSRHNLFWDLMASMNYNSNMY